MLKGTKRKLLTSAIALLACVALLTIGTFAWFTDKAKNEDNYIKAGTLSASFYAGNSSAVITTPASNEITSGAFPVAADQPSAFMNLKGNTSSKIFNFTNWEPGKSETKYLLVKNEGSLPLKYRVYFDGEHGSQLATLLKFTLAKQLASSTSLDGITGTVFGVTNGTALNLASMTGTLQPGQSAVYKVSVELPGLITGNSFQGTDFTFDVKLNATQLDGNASLIF